MVKIAFQHLLEACAKQYHWVLIQEQTLKRSLNKRIHLDGVLFDSSHLVRGYWEAKDAEDDLSFEVEKKRYQDDYPQDNIIYSNARASDFNPKWERNIRCVFERTFESGSGYKYLF